MVTMNFDTDIDVGIGSHTKNGAAVTPAEISRRIKVVKVFMVKLLIGLIFRDG